jgi:regulator of sigma E protease
VIQAPGFLWTILFFALAIGPLIFLHEMGHYLVGRWCGVKADVFSIGFGRELFGWTDKRGTRWKLSLLPLGGYVMFAGDRNAASEPSEDWKALPEGERNRTFQGQALWKRAAIIAAGPLTNFLIAILIFVGVFAIFGEPRTPPIVDQVIAGSAAEAAGMKSGDRILAIGDREIARFEDIGRVVMLHPDEVLTFRILRGTGELVLQATPKPDIVKDRFGNQGKRGLLGISARDRVIVHPPLWELPGDAVHFTADSVRMMAETLKQVITGTRSVKDLGGPIKIAQISGQQAKLGPVDFILFMTMISINLGFINLLPIPMLDGGHLFFYAIEGVRRKPVSIIAQEWAFRAGLLLVLTFMVVVTFNDLGSFGLWNRLAGLIG